MSDSQQPAVRILTQTVWEPDTVILPCDHTLQEGARGRHQLYVVVPVVSKQQPPALLCGHIVREGQILVSWTGVPAVDCVPDLTLPVHTHHVT